MHGEVKDEMNMNGAECNLHRVTYSSTMCKHTDVVGPGLVTRVRFKKTSLCSRQHSPSRNIQALRVGESTSLMSMIMCMRMSDQFIP